MREFFTFFYEQRGGIFVFLGCVFCLAALLRYLVWIFGLGRFRAQSTTSTTGTGPARATDGRIVTTTTGPSRETDDRIGFVVAEFFAKLINDFRHLLALMLVLIFAAALGVAMWIADKDVDTLTKAIQGVTATLGGLIGSIIGYYFGESAGKRSQPDGTKEVIQGGPAEQSGSDSSNPSEKKVPITETRKPPPPG